MSVFVPIPFVFITVDLLYNFRSSMVIFLAIVLLFRNVFAIPQLMCVTMCFYTYTTENCYFKLCRTVLEF